MTTTKNPNILYTLKHNLCLGCGICVDACPTKSISIGIDNGEYRPTINPTTCINSKGCHKCSMVCPGIGVNLQSITNQLYRQEGTIYDHKTGYYLSSYYGYATDLETRWHGASGGLLTAFIAFLLDKGYISAAVVSENDLKQPFLNKIVLIHQSCELYRTRSSKYCPVKFDGIVEQVKKEKGKVVIVGLPCIMHGFRKYEMIDRDFQNHIWGYIGLYCSCGRTFNLTEYVFQKNQIDKASLSYFQYRDEGCLGSMVTIDKNGIKKIPFQLYYHPLRSFFIPNRCLFCTDHFAEMADIAFGDIHVGEFKKDTVGLNSVIVRKSFIDELLRKANLAGYIKISPLTKDELISCQTAIRLKKGRTNGVFTFCKLLGVKLPQYDMDLVHMMRFNSALYYLFAKLQMFIGKRRWLWPIIPFLTKKGKVC